MTKHEWLLSLFPGTGYFVEAGAHDGVGDSQTHQLEIRGWDGICVEPSSAFAGLQRNRKCKVDGRALWLCDNATVEFMELDGGEIELSGIPCRFDNRRDRPGLPHKMVAKKTVTLTTLLREHNAPSVIEFLSLDTEGSEHDILAAHDFLAFSFLAIAVEKQRDQSRQEAIERLLASHGYRKQTGDPHDDWYSHRSIMR